MAQAEIPANSYGDDEEQRKTDVTSTTVDELPVEGNICSNAAEQQIVDEGQLPPAEEPLEKAPAHVSLVPPEDCEKVTQDGGVLKKVLEPGEPGETPTLHARCLIHYVGYLASNGERFMDTKNDRETDEPVVVVAGRNAAAQETGLCLAAATMTRGERALVYIVDPSYGYGKQGSFSFPCVPPNSQLVYELELVNWEGIEGTDNDHDRGSLLFEERLERAERRREAGNVLFKEGKYKEALAKYALALSYMDEDFMYQLEGHYLDKAEAVKLRIHLNMAATQLKIPDYTTAIYNCGQVLQLDERNVKALFRRGKARHALGRTEEALQDLEAALKIDPTDKAIIAEMHALRATIKKERQAEVALFKGRLKSNSSAAGAADGAVAVPDGTASSSSSVTKTADSRIGEASPSGRTWDVETEIEAFGDGIGGEEMVGSSGREKAGSAVQKKGGVDAGAGARVGEEGQQGQGLGRVLAGVLAWLWSMIGALLMVGQRRAVQQKA